jgi:hypothetical protein
MKKIFLLLLTALMLLGCNHDFGDVAINNAEQIFGITFNNDWNTVSTSSVTVNSQNMSKIQILAYVETDSLNYTSVLNEVEGGSTVTLNYDAPLSAKQILVAGLSNEGKWCVKPITSDVVNLNVENRALTRSASTRASITPTITGSLTSYETQRGYPGFENEVLYTTNLDVNAVDNYSENDQLAIRMMIFEYLPNGKGYDNLPQILANGYYNNDCYAVTTGISPIIVSPIYKNDGGYHEVETGELYYYYFKGDLSVDEIKALPKYKAIQVSDYLLADDELKKHHSYTLAYFGDGVTPTETGSYDFPKGYKIGFMFRMNFKDNVKKGELYFDGRLNTKINQHGHFKSSKLGATDPRMCWLSVNEMMFMCCEAGTDRDFNDVVFEIEGVEPIDIPIPPVYNEYTFCYEDLNLGDYDINDVVLKGKRLNATQVQWTIMATGATNELYIRGINGNIINKNKEIHSYFGIAQDQYANVSVRNEYPTVTEVVIVPTTFSFKHNAPTVWNETQGYEVKLATKGEDPHAIMIPYDFKWPKEKVRVNLAYPRFNEWGSNSILSTDWYLYPVSGNVVE